MRKWRIEDSEELYNITGWGTSYFGINDKGHVVVTLSGIVYCLLYDDEAGKSLGICRTLYRLEFAY